MLILGAGGHAKEVFEVLKLQYPEANFAFYDDNPYFPEVLLGCPVLKTDTTAQDWLQKNDNSFTLGTGNPKVRQKLYDKFISLGAKPIGCLANTAILGRNSIVLGQGVDIMHRVLITTHAVIGKGSLLNAGCAVHHDVIIGSFCEIGPGAGLLGSCQIGDNSIIGGGAVILPGVKIGKGAIIGAGAVVRNDVPDNVTAAGVPAKFI